MYKRQEVTDLKCLKTGMTNKSFLFKARERSYICRIPGPGTDLLINRAQEKAVYDAIKPLGISEHVIYMLKRQTNGVNIRIF